jgi:uncharacterized cofD-like protein
MKKIVTVGGGTGSYTILSGLKHIPNISLTALVSMADNGGSTGVLRDELGVLPPGDVRQCLVALSEHSDTVRKLISYRFTSGKLSGHSFGNIFLAALEKVTGDFAEGVSIASEILKVRGQVIPITKDKADLVLKLTNNTTVKGEDAINHADLQKVGVKKIEYKNKVSLNEHARVAIHEADMIIIGPGNYYCSLVPNLIVPGFKEAIKKSKAVIVVPVNLTNKQGHTMNWRASDYVKHIETYLGRRVHVIIVNKEKPSKKQVALYQVQEGDGVLVTDDLQGDTRVIRAPLLARAVIQKTKGDVLHGLRSFIRHDPNKMVLAVKKVITKKL